MVKFSKTIGIIGGAGPMASAFLYSTILRICQQEYHANDYSEFPEIILISYPFTRGDENKISKEIEKCLSILEKAQTSLFCISSHSFHGFLPPTLPKNGFVSLVSESLKEASRLQISKALIVASETTIQLQLYEQSEITCIYPPSSDQNQINQLIREVASGKINSSQAKELKKIIANLQAKEMFDGVVIACTELPLIFDRFPIETETLQIIEPIQVLAKTLVKRALYPLV